MKILDRYIIRKFLGTFFFMLAIIMSIAVVFDISEKLEKFMKNDAPFSRIVLDYYVNFIFYYGNLFSSLLIFLSVLLFTSQMAQRTEIVSIFAGGISFKRFLYPYFVGATILVGVSLYFTHYQLPIANETRLAFEEEYLRQQFSIKEKNLHRQYAPNAIAYFENFSPATNVGYRFSMEEWSNDGELKAKLFADRARFGCAWGAPVRCSASRSRSARSRSTELCDRIAERDR